MEFRHKGKQALKSVLKKAHNINIIEKNLYEASCKTKQYESVEKTYLTNLYQLIIDIGEGKKLGILLSEIKNNNLGWNHSTFQNVKKCMEEQDNFIENPFEVAEGVFECHKILANGNKCGSKRVFSYTKQVRSADEPESIFATCCACGAKWTYSG